jgi:hypothetical protein
VAAAATVKTADHPSPAVAEIEIDSRCGGFLEVMALEV